jgi:hypothetical protein
VARTMAMLIATHLRIQLLPFLSQNGREFLIEQGLCFLAQKAIGGYHERCKMTSLLEASLKVLLLFLPLVGV